MWCCEDSPPTLKVATAAHCFSSRRLRRRPWIHREGVLAHQPSATDLMFITLRKSEALFSPTTR